MNNQMFIVHATDYKRYPLGGTIGTIKNYLKYTQFECVLVGIANEKSTKIGKWTKVEINGRNYDFFPVARSKKGVIPHKILMLLGTTIYSSRILKKCNSNIFSSMLFVNRECYLPIKYIFGRRKIINVFYKMTEAVNPITTSGRLVSKIKVLQYLYLRVFIRSLLFGSSVIFSINSECRELCERVLTKSKERRKIVDVHHYVDYDYLLKKYQDIETAKGNKNKTLVFWGRLAVVKGLDLMINSVLKVLEDGLYVELLIIGEGAERRRLEILIENHAHRDKIKFLGRLDINDIAAICKTADLFVMSSFTEGIPTSMLEAMTFGLPILSVDVGGIPTLVLEGVNGHLVKERNVDIYSLGIKKSLMLDKKTAAKYGRNLVMSKFSAKSVVKQMDQLILKEIYKHRS